MLHVIPAPLHRAALRVAHALRKRWWRLCKPDLRGCRVLALDDDGRVLLVRHAYGSGWWMAPGGGLKRSEDALAGALRELREETGCTLADPFEVVCSRESLQGAANTVHIIAGRTADMPRPDGREVVDARFFAADALPADLLPLLRTHLPDWIRAARAGRPVAPDPAPARRPAPIA